MKKLVSLLLALALVCFLLSTVTFAASEAPEIGYREVVNGQNNVRLRFVSASAPTLLEKNAILTTHTGNLNFHSFAAEIAVHAEWANHATAYVRERAIRADMVVGAEHNTWPGSLFDSWYYDLSDPRVVAFQNSHTGYGS